jgi:hypothetical protein
VNNNTGNPFFYAELYKYDGTTFTLLGSSVGVPEYINQGTIIAPYYFAIPVPTSALALTDRLAIRIYVNVDGRTVTLHTENGHLCQVVTTLSKGMVSLNNLTDQSQFITTGTSGTDFNIVSSGDTHTFNIPSASASNRGLITTGAQTIGGSKTFSSAISGDAGVLLKNGFTTYSNSYTSLGGNVGNLVISGSISSSPFDNELAFTPSTSNTYTFPDLSGTLALLEGEQTFSGNKEFTGLASFTNANGTYTQYGITLTKGSAPTGFFTSNVSIYADAGVTNLVIANHPTYKSKLQFQDAATLTSSFTYTFPALSGTMALLEGTQTFTGAKTFSLGILAVGGIGFPETVGGSNYGGIIGSSSFFQIAAQNGSTILIKSSNNTNAITISTVGKVDFGSTIGNGTFTYTLPSATGTLALTSDLGAYVTLATAQTISGAKTFSLDITVNGLTFGRGGGGYSLNTALGLNALSSNTTGGPNTAIGASALSKNTTGFGNTGVGQGALNDNTTGTVNSGFGQGALGNQTTGSGNTGLGYNAGAAITTGSFNIEIGYLNNGSGVVTGSYNTIIGSNITGLSASLANNIILADGAGNIRYRFDGTTNQFNGPSQFNSVVSINTGSQASLSILSSTGNSALILGYVNSVLKGTIDISATEFKLISAIDNILKFQSSTNFRASLIFSNTADYSYTYPNASGTIALLSGTQTFTGATTFSSSITVSGISVGTAGNGSNIKLGDSNFGAITTGSNNIAIGSSALSSITTSNANIGIGNSALASVVDGAFNIALGFGVGASITSGSNNTLFGYGAGQSITTGNYNTILGAYAGTAGMSNNIVLSDGQGNIRYQWNGTNNVFGNPISGTSATFSGSVTSDDVIFTAGTLFGAGNTGFSNRASDTTLYLQMPATGFNITDNALNTRFILSSTGAATFSSSVRASAMSIGIAPTSNILVVRGENSTNDGTIQFGIRGFLQHRDSGQTTTSLANDYVSDSAKMEFRMKGNTTSDAKMTILGSGNVGIGTSNPAAKLEIQEGHLRLYTNFALAGGGYAVIWASDAGGTNTSFATIEGVTTTDGVRRGDIKFNTSNNGGPTEKMRITSGGDVLVGMTSNTGSGTTSVRAGLISGQRTDSADAVFQAWNQATSGNNNFVEFKTEGGGTLRGSIDYNRAVGLVRYNVTSDYRLKTDLKEFNGSDILNKVKVYDYKLKETEERVYGVMAHELQEILPYAVSGEKDELYEDGTIKTQGVDYSKLVPILVKAIQEQQAQIELLSNKIVALESK